MNGGHAAAKDRKDCGVEKSRAGRLVRHHVNVKPRAFQQAKRRKRAHSFVPVHKIVAEVENSQQEVQKEYCRQG